MAAPPLVADGFEPICVETRQTQHFLSTRPVKTDRNDARGIAKMMRIGHYRPFHVKSAEAQLVRTLLQARRQIVAALLQMQGTIRGLLRMHGLKIREFIVAAPKTERGTYWRKCRHCNVPSSRWCGFWSS